MARDRSRPGGRAAGAGGLFEPLRLARETPPSRLTLAAAFAEALASFRAGRFAEAAGAFAALAGVDGVSRRDAERAERYRAEPPPEGWDGVTTLESK